MSTEEYQALWAHMAATITAGILANKSGYNYIAKSKYCDDAAQLGIDTSLKILNAVQLATKNDNKTKP
jgi:hypothetical protein